MLLRLFKAFKSVLERLRLVLRLRVSDTAFSTVPFVFNPLVSISNTWPRSNTVEGLSLIRTLEDLFFVALQNELFNFPCLSEDSESFGEMEEDFVENLGKHRIGSIIDRTQPCRTEILYDNVQTEKLSHTKV